MLPVMPASSPRSCSEMSWAASLFRIISQRVSWTELTLVSYSLLSRSIIFRMSSEAEIFPFRSRSPPKSIEMR